MRPPAIALSNMRTVPVGESIAVANGGRDVAVAIHMPPTALPISIAQIARGMPAFNWPGNISAPNETILAIKTIDAIRPAMESCTALRPIAPSPEDAAVVATGLSTEAA